jgi:hypothetical protein
MSKPTITRLFIGSVIAVIAGLVLGLVAIVAAFTGDAFVMDGPDVVGFAGDAFGWSMIGLTIVGFVGVIAGSIGGLVAWIGALLNTAQLDDKVWFIVLLVLGILSFGLIAMIAYVIAGPDGTRRPATPDSQPVSIGGAPA